MELTGIAEQLIGFGIVGIFATTAVSYIRAKIGASDGTSKMITIGVAVAFGIIVYVLSLFPNLWQAIIGILGASQIFYGFVAKDAQVSNKK